MSRAILTGLILLLGLPCGFAEDRPPPKVFRPYGARVTFHNQEAPEKPPVEDPKQDKEPSTIPMEFEKPLELQIPTPRPPKPPKNGPDREAHTRGTSIKEDKGSGWGWLADEVQRQPTNNATSYSDADPDATDDWLSPEQDGGLTNGWSREDTSPRNEIGTEGSSNSLFMSSPVAVLQDNPGWRPLETESLTMADSERKPRPPGEASDFGSEATPWESPFSPVDPWRTEQAEPTRAGDALERPTEKEDVRRSAFFREDEGVPSDYGALPGLARPDESARANLFSDPGAGTAGSFGGLPSASTFGSLGAVVIQPSISAPSALSPSLALPSQMSTERPTLNEMGTEGHSRPKALPW